MDVQRSMNTIPPVGGANSGSASGVNAPKTSQPANAEPTVSKGGDPWKASARASSPRVVSQLKSVTTTTRINEHAKPEAKSFPTTHFYHIGYQLPDVGKGMTSATFPLRIDQGQQKRGTDQAWNEYNVHFSAKDPDGTAFFSGHIGMRLGEDGQAQATFSIPRSEQGESKETTIGFQPGRKYDLTVERDAGNHAVLKGFVQDVTDSANPGPRQHIGDAKFDRDVVLANDPAVSIDHIGKVRKTSDIGYTQASFYAPSAVSEQGKPIQGSLTQGNVDESYEDSITGYRNTTMVGQRTVEVKLGLRGAS